MYYGWAIRNFNLAKKLAICEGKLDPRSMSNPMISPQVAKNDDNNFPHNYITAPTPLVTRATNTSSPFF